jgi:S-DNA-T family DNA segregation ATPase FtsK/SpoIIIE
VDVAARAKVKSKSDGATERVRVSSPRAVAAVPVIESPKRRFISPRDIDVSPRLRDELIAFAIFTVAVIMTLPILGLAGDSVLNLLGEGIRSLTGLAAIAVPFGLSIIAVEIWREGDAGQRTRRFTGGVLALVAAVGLLWLADQRGDVSGSGGLAGEGAGRLLMSVLGEVGAGIVMLAAGIAGVFLVTGYDTREIADSWRRIRPRRLQPVPTDHELSEVEDAIDHLLPEHSGFLAQSETTNSTAPLVPAATSSFPRPEADPHPKHEKRTPVIRLPKSDKAGKEVRAAVEAVAKPENDAADLNVTKRTKGWKLPTLTALTLYESTAPDKQDLEAKARRIEESLSSFKVEASVREIFPGPAVTLFTLEPGPGVKVRRITELQNDLALALAATSLRIEAPVPGMARVGLEIPNGSISTVGLRETLESSTFVKTNAKLPLPLGRDVNGRYVIGDLTKMPHLLIAGSTGSGKSVCINGIIATFLMTKSPEDLQMVMIDPKMVELAGYEGVPHLKTPVVTDMSKVVSALKAVLREMERRYQLFTRLGVRNIDGYELRRSTDPTLEKLPYLILIIDELADLMMTTPDEVETLLVRLAQMARATGIHLLIATQRPSVDVLTGLLKANVPARIAFAVSSLTDSRVILDIPGAERLLGRGDMLYMPPDAAKPVRIQGSFIDDADLQKIVKHWRMLTPNLVYDSEWANLPSSRDPDDDESEDPLMDQALAIVKQQGTASASMLQRRLRIGYNRAARLIERMEDEGIIGPADGSRGRTVIGNEDWDDG